MKVIHLSVLWVEAQTLFLTHDPEEATALVVDRGATGT
jgi:hypothetical protein